MNLSQLLLLLDRSSAFFVVVVVVAPTWKITWNSFILMRRRRILAAKHWHTMTCNNFCGRAMWAKAKITTQMRMVNVASLALPNIGRCSPFFGGHNDVLVFILFCGLAHNICRPTQWLLRKSFNWIANILGECNMRKQRKPDIFVLNLLCPVTLFIFSINLFQSLSDVAVQLAWLHLLHVALMPYCGCAHRLRMISLSSFFVCLL